MTVIEPPLAIQAPLEPMLPSGLNRLTLQSNWYPPLSTPLVTLSASRRPANPPTKPPLQRQGFWLAFTESEMPNFLRTPRNSCSGVAALATRPPLKITAATTAKRKPLILRLLSRSTVWLSDRTLHAPGLLQLDADAAEEAVGQVHVVECGGDPVAPHRSQADVPQMHPGHAGAVEDSPEEIPRDGGSKFGREALSTTTPAPLKSQIVLSVVLIA